MKKFLSVGLFCLFSFVSLQVEASWWCCCRSKKEEGDGALQIGQKDKEESDVAVQIEQKDINRCDRAAQLVKPVQIRCSINGFEEAWSVMPPNQFAYYEKTRDSVVLCNTDTGEEERSFATGYARTIDSLAGNLLTSNFSGEMQFWSRKSGELVRKVQAYDDNASCPIYTIVTGDNCLLTLMQGGNLKRWNPLTGELLSAEPIASPPGCFDETNYDSVQVGSSSKIVVIARDAIKIFNSKRVGRVVALSNSESY